MAAAAPRIARHAWGRVEMADGRTFRDAKLYPGGAREWDWRETGTRHEPGIQPADVQELLDHGASVVVLSKGVYERLRTCGETLDLLRQRGIPVHVLQTDDAVAEYNRLRETHAAGALIHSTC
ncbi:hypothetical protein SAMN05216241_101501 [Limimonas halophila]|uniref:Mth938-like domain-containing protein n=1 Tax=Limimonas halophila TaxID=1082479 RepID=A0A1G7M6S3_9PROT|nr:Mth938-like domain-containing protein [Limimonas halophila]SDF57403.1 hypothetical protein SAMN05216241_101501 [Limimonas halophila]